jgi:hypothetical protein
LEDKVGGCNVASKNANNGVRIPEPEARSPFPFFFTRRYKSTKYQIVRCLWAND